MWLCPLGHLPAKWQLYSVRWQSTHECSVGWFVVSRLPTGRESSLWCWFIHRAGDASLEKEAARICDPSSFPPSSLVDIVIATPGRLAEHLMRGSFTSLQSMRYVASHLCLYMSCDVSSRFLVIDEADKLLSQQMCSWLPRLLQQVTVSSSGGLLAWLNSRSEVSHVLPSPLPPSSLPTPAHLPVATALACASSLLSTQQRVQKLLLSATMTQDPEALEVLQLHRYVQWPQR